MFLRSPILIIFRLYELLVDLCSKSLNLINFYNAGGAEAAAAGLPPVQKDRYRRRPLPFIIGTNEFNQDELCGLYVPDEVCHTSRTHACTEALKHASTHIHIIHIFAKGPLSPPAAAVFVLNIGS